MTLLEKLQQDGIRRLGTPKTGFRYRTAAGKAVTGAEKARIEALKLPPAWTDVYINPNKRAHLVAVGKDKAGRWQYRYAEHFSRQQEALKYERLMSFAEVLPKMRKRVDHDLSRPGLGREKVMAAALRILSTCFVRPGSAAYAQENGSFGLATLRDKHVSIKGDLICLDFTGKSGKPQHRELRDRRVARLLAKLKTLPGKEILKWVTDDGAVVDVRRRDINQYIKEVMGEHFSAKDFRTWAGTLICACALARAGIHHQDSDRVKKKKLVQAVKETAEHLGNTPAVCRSSYIYPTVLSHFERGKVIERYFETVQELVEHDQADFHCSEEALLRLLKEKAKPEAAPAA
ncbi:MAG TPA: DNA topoisomerase IB [Myxococcaceae bacterium]|nr:DNA topoisomerase IB [Myxococcaceae bacterium]